jgi:hypothetical protein
MAAPVSFRYKKGEYEKQFVGNTDDKGTIEETMPTSYGNREL